MPLLLYLSQSFVWIVLALVAQLITLRLLRLTGRQLQASTPRHDEPFDLQNRLTVQDIAEQLPAYTPETRRLYTRFFVIDFFFPLSASLFLSLLWTALLQRPDTPLFADALDWGLPLLAFAPTLFDWGENVCFLLLIRRYPPLRHGMARLAVGFKRLKLFMLMLTFGITLVLVLATLILALR